MVSNQTQGDRTLDGAGVLVRLMAGDEALWSPGVHIETAYVQQALRYLTKYIEGDWSLREAYDALKEMQP